MKPAISVIIPTFNYGRFLPDALESIQDQTLSDWEAIVVDDGSIDETAEVVDSYLSDHRFRYIYQDNQGLPAARNTGIRVSKADLVTFLDADDLYLPEKLEKQLAHLKKNPDCDFTYCSINYFYHKTPGRLIRPGYTPYEANNSYKIISRNFIPSCTPVIRKRCFDQVGLFNESSDYAEDWELWIRMALAGIRFCHQGEVLCLVRIHGENLLSSQEKHQKREKELVEEIRQRVYQLNNQRYINEWRLMDVLWRYRWFGRRLLTGHEEANERVRFLRVTRELLFRDTLRFIKGVATFLYGLLPRALRNRLVTKIGSFLSPYQRLFR